MSKTDKVFKEGMVAGAKPFGEKLDQLAEQQGSGIDKISEGLDGVTGVVSELIDDMESSAILAERAKFGLNTEMDISGLPDDRKEILVSLLLTLLSKHEQNNDEQKDYYFSVKQHLEVANPVDDFDFSLIEDIDSRAERKMMFQIVCEFLFLGSCDRLFLAEFSGVIDAFDLKSNIIDEVIENVEAVYSVLGIRGIQEHFALAEPEEFVVEEENFEDTEQEEIPEEIEVLNITSMIQVASGQTVSYKYKEIHLSSLVNCAGTLEFDNCVITYNETAAADEITLAENAEIRATNCTFICKGIDKNFFITPFENSSAIFDRCIFVDCSYFIASNAKYSLQINNCEFLNCTAFAILRAGKMELSNTKINIDKPIPDGAEKILFESSSPECTVDGVVINACNCKLSRTYFHMVEGNIKNSSFFGATGNIIRAKFVNNCYFENCNGNDEKRSNLVNLAFVAGSEIKSCIFENCSRVITTGERSIVTQCKFISCSNQLINSTESGCASTISYCEFINYKNTAEDKNQGDITSRPTPGISLAVGKKTSNSIIEKCVFDGIDINEGFLITSVISGKLSGNMLKVRGCDFRNCSTRRASGKIIRTYAHYIGLFDKLYTELAVSVENCRGLDSVKQNGTGVCSDQAVLSTVTEAKANTGAVVSSIAAGLIGGPIALAAVSGINAINKYSKQKKEEEISAKAKDE